MSKSDLIFRGNASTSRHHYSITTFALVNDENEQEFLRHGTPVSWYRLAKTESRGYVLAREDLQRHRGELFETVALKSFTPLTQEDWSDQDEHYFDDVRKMLVVRSHGITADDCARWPGFDKVLQSYRRKFKTFELLLNDTLDGLPLYTRVLQISAHPCFHGGSCLRVGRIKFSDNSLTGAVDTNHFKDYPV